MTLAIGDGANDVGMILEADVGVGISGHEGRQAALNSDYSFAQFRFLKRLLLVHGRLNFYRNVELVFYCFYKNMVFTLNQFWFGIYNGFSGNTCFDSVLYTLFNVIFSSAPPVVYAGLERDVSQKSMMLIPELYYFDGKRKYMQSMIRFWKYQVLGIIHSLITFFVPYLSMHPFIRQDGKVIGFNEFGTNVYMCVVLTINIRIASMCSYWTWLHHVFIWASILSFPVTVALVDVMGISPTLTGTTKSLLSTSVFYVSFFATSVVSILPIIWNRIYKNTTNSFLNRVLYFERHHKGGNLINEVKEFIPEEEPVRSPNYVDRHNSTGFNFEEPDSRLKSRVVSYYQTTGTKPAEWNIFPTNS